MKRQKNNFLICITLVIGTLLSGASLAATVNIATVPLATATTTSVLPNLMFTIDDSGSMDRNFLPDWVDDSICKNTTGAYDRSCTNQPPFRSSDYNGIYYNPAITYTPAVNADGTSRASQTSWTSVKNDAYNIQDTGSTNLVTGYTDVEWCTNAVDGSGNPTDCLRNDNYILPGTLISPITSLSASYTTPRASRTATGSGRVATGSPFAPTTASRSWGPHYYTIVPGEYCDSPRLNNCQFTQTATFSYPAKVRWCSSSANATAATPAAGSCQGLRTGSYTNPRYPTKFFTPAVAAQPAVAYVAPVVGVRPTGLLTFGGTKTASDGRINNDLSGSKSVKVDTTTAFSNRINIVNSTPIQVAAAVVSAIGTSGSIKAYVGGNSVTPTCASQTNNVVCLVDTSTYANGRVVAIGSIRGQSSLTVSRTSTAGGVTPVAEVFAQPAIPAQDAFYPGRFVRTDIVSGSSYPKASTRSDCTGAVGPSGCSYAEEMTNFANWWTYYQTRMQAMKTSASIAFKPIDSRYRVGFNSISYTGATDGTKFLGINTFNTAHKALWYTKLFASNPSSFTPLRGALSKTGRIFAKKLTGAADPMQYSCQQNFTILSTDGYWNTDNETSSYGPFDLNGASVGNKDGGSTPRPMFEGVVASSTLADVAKYYYDTDLRDSSLGNCTGALGIDVCENNVFVSGTDNNVKQHMTTFTLGLGLDGTLLYTDDYKTADSGDFYDLKNGFGSPVVNWSNPLPSENETRIDDLWHAAVNGQGTYFSAKDPQSLTRGLSDALSQINSKVGAGAAAATSTLNPVAGDNFAYVASYTTVKWAGNLEARTINLTTGAVSEAATWCVEDVVTASCSPPSSIVTETSGSSTRYYCVTPSATSCNSPSIWDGTSCKVEVPVACTGTLRGAVSAGTRSIKMNGGGVLKDFKYSNLTPAQQNFFKTSFLSANLSQWSSLSASQQSNVDGDNLVNFLRGEKDYEDSGSNDVEDRVFRYRESVMGDALESAPVYVGKPNMEYSEGDYATFKTTSRSATVYMGTNDGMLHAFNASDGTERWAYVPSMVLENMWKLADKNYATMHTNYVNGTTTVSDICSSSCSGSGDWKTILVGGLNGGGKGFYALNVTGDTPSLLWEFDATDDSDVGYSFGNPVITKLAPDGTYPLGRWVVLLTSGYNNTTGSNPGKGFLYVLDANTGSIIRKIQTGTVGSVTTPSGLAKIVSWVDYPSKNNMATYTYGGDLLGNLWRFDINSAYAPGTNPFLMATLKDSSGAAQPITTRPELGKASNNRAVFVGTGKYLEVSDLTDTQQQTIYGIKDTGTFFDNARNYLTQQTLVTAGANRTAAYSTTDFFSSGNGWYVNFPDSGERQNVSARLVSGTLIVPSTVPSNTVCSPGGYGWVNYLNYKTGGAVDVTTMVSTKTNAPPVGINIVYIGGKPVVSVTTSNDPTPELVPNAKFNLNPSGFSSKRAIWRELIE